jgi:hypothetical protein
MNLQKRADYREAPVCAGASFSLGHAHKNVRCQGAKRPSLTLSRSVFALLELRCLLALVILMRLVDCVSAATLSGKADIVDGDTIKVGGIAVRLDGIDAFETEQTCERAGKSYACGKEATKALASLISGRFPLGQSIFGCAKCTARMLGSSRAPRQMNSSINSGVLNSDP